MSSVSLPKMQEFCSIIGYSKNTREQEEFSHTVLSAAKGAVDSSIIGAPCKRMWGSIVGCLFLAPTKWGKFASTLNLTASRVTDALQLTFAGMHGGMNLNPNMISGPNNNVTHVFYGRSNQIDHAFNRLISRIQPAIAADIVNEGLPKHSTIDERAYNKYFLASSVVGTIAIAGIMGAIAAVAYRIPR